jgi:hypothetical protein
MSTIGYGYGSEWHFIRYLAYHRDLLEKRLCELGNFQSVEFLDSPFSGNPSILHDDSEYGGIEFLDAQIVGNERLTTIKEAWETFWPQTGTPPQWDAIAVAKREEESHYLIFEAKAHSKELRSDCTARPVSSMIIEGAFEQTRAELGIVTDNDWMKNYYQIANRIAVCNFLNQHDVSTYIVNLYFMGERSPLFPRKSLCPNSVEEWEAELELQYHHLGLQPGEYDRLLNLFLHINEEYH